MLHLGPDFAWLGGFLAVFSRLGDAEERSLEQYVERAELVDGMNILDLGCGWGGLEPDPKITAPENG